VAQPILAAAGFQAAWLAALCIGGARFSLPSERKLGHSPVRGKMKPMGFYLWVDDQLAWAQGTYEYRPMGAAVISKSDLFRRRDFSPRRSPRPPRTARFAGQFASLGHLNQHLQTARRR
jgi:hypothetical protein